MKIRNAPSFALRKLLLVGAILLLASGCNSGDKTNSGQVKPHPQATAVFQSRFHKLDNWNELQPLSKWKGEYLVLNFWATWCKSCQHEVPELNKLYNQFKDKNTVVVGLAIDNADKVKDYIKQYGVDYPILVGGDEAMELSKKMGNKVGGLPFTIMITPQGEVVEKILGATKKGTLPKVLEPHIV
jgi:thiol-disulfide isomerase/thioredoxin